MVRIAEAQFEEDIETVLHQHGYLSHPQPEYDREHCLIGEDVVNFLMATQPKKWQQLTRQYGENTRARFLTRLAAEITRRGTLDVLRKGIHDVGIAIKLAYFQPASGLNEELQRKYRANMFRVVRQLRYSQRSNQSLDIALFLNGLPIFTAELKNPLNGQNVQHAIKQYRKDRDPNEPIFANTRCLAHFAIDPDYVYFSTRLQSAGTRFFPFNQGRNGASGNPPSGYNQYATAYLWKETWAKDSILNLISQFIFEVTRQGNQRRGNIIFPRYHQLDATRRLVEDARTNGAGRRYLVQHSAGSGKSFTIAWLAHQLSKLHNANDERVFNTIIVVTDRRVLDSQLQYTVRQFEQTLGLVTCITQNSQQLAEAIRTGGGIIVTTLQKFPFISAQISGIPESNYAVIIDEAHSSQTGETAAHLRTTLAGAAQQNGEDQANPEKQTMEDLIEEEIRQRGILPNVSFFAFTATPKPKTLELFGTPAPTGAFQAFSLYSMRQAIEESFILNVLENYTTYKTYWNLLKKIEEDPRYDRVVAQRLLRNFVDLNEITLEKKLNIILEHFNQQVMKRINGKAKAMIVTRSRLHAVRYRLMIDQMLRGRNAPYKALVAFSGTVHDGGIDYTETQMNGFPESQTANRYEENEYRFLIVAEKFQTGFDQPLLHTMYVDKKLNGLHAVQTLSRLNRIHPDKSETMVLDFVNEAEIIREAFEPYFEHTILSEGTDPNQLYELRERLWNYHLFDQGSVDRFAETYYAPNGGPQAQLYDVLAPVVRRYSELEEDEKSTFKTALQDYTRQYAFLSQIITFTDVDLAKLYHFSRLLRRVLPQDMLDLPLEITENIDLENLRIERTHVGEIPLQRGDNALQPVIPKEALPGYEDIQEALSKIIEELNNRFGTEFNGDDLVLIEQLERKLGQHPALESAYLVNNEDNFKLAFEEVVKTSIQESIDNNFKFVKHFSDNPDFAGFLIELLFSRFKDNFTRTAESEE